MQLLETCTVHRESEVRHIKLYQGDLAAIPPTEAVDLLVISAFPDNYVPTPTSLIGALDRRGVSVEQLARDKAVDLRDAFSCWLSKDLPDNARLGFKRILCFEPLRRGNPTELTGDIYRAIMPFALAEPQIRSMAMSVLASGNEHFDEVAMFRSLFAATVRWLSHGMPIETVKIVVYADASALRIRPVFAELAALVPAAPPAIAVPDSGSKPDCFISYSRTDSDAVKALVDGLRMARPDLRVFQDTLELRVGDSWQNELDRALENCRKVIAVYSPAYLKSKMCMEEFNMARIRHRESEEGVLIPVYLRSTELPLYMRSLQYVDCRESDLDRIKLVSEGDLLAAFGRDTI
jgi:hypothetical protein